MTYWPLLLILLPVGILLLIVAVRLLVRPGWIGGFVSGALGIGCLLVILVTTYLVVDLASYRSLRDETAVATLSFTRLADQRYQLEFTRADQGDAERYELTGDDWQLDAHILSWQGPLTLLGMEPVYRLKTLSSYYRSLEQERSRDPEHYALDRDGWLSMSRFERVLPWVEGRLDGAAYLPMVDGGVFEVGVSEGSLEARPVNEPAQAAVARLSSE